MQCAYDNGSLKNMFVRYPHLQNKIKMFCATEKDSRIIWEWRNHFEVRRNCFNTQPISWQEHNTWFLQKLSDTYTKIYIARYGGDKVGVIRFHIKDQSVYVNVNLNPAFFSRGLGSALIHSGTGRFLEEIGSRLPIVALIKKDNIRSQKAFAKAGYEVIDKKEKDVVVYRYDNTKGS